jgi:hypothetical protein
MKRCPSCEFTFADFHRVCDFDGAELVDEPPRPPAPAKTPSRFWRVLKSEMFVAAAGLVFVLASALLVGYYEVTNQLNSTAGNQTAPGASVSPAPNSAQAPDKAPAEDETPVASARASDQRNSKRSHQSAFTLRRQTNIARVSTRAPREALPTSTAKNRPGKSPFAVEREVKEEAAHRKDPKLVAVLKTTWNVLKKPFKF